MPEPAALLDVDEALLDQVFRLALQIGVEGGVNAKATLIDPLPAETLDECLAHFLLEVQAVGLADVERVLQA